MLLNRVWTRFHLSAWDPMPSPSNLGSAGKAFKDAFRSSMILMLFCFPEFYVIGFRVLFCFFVWLIRFTIVLCVFIYTLTDGNLFNLFNRVSETFSCICM